MVKLSQMAVPFGIKNNQFVTVDSVERGLKCNCICPKCRKSLVANKGKKYVHYFSHHQSSDCTFGNKTIINKEKISQSETLIHKLAKQLIQIEKTILFPSLTYQRINHLQDEQIVYKGGYLCHFDFIKMEKRMDGFQPDIVGTYNQKKYIIEIAVTSFISEKKLDKLLASKLNVMQIDLSYLPEDTTLERLKYEVLKNPNNRTWVINYDDQKNKNTLFKQCNKLQVIKDSFGWDIFGKVKGCPKKLHKLKDGASAWIHECQKCSKWYGFHESVNTGIIYCKN